MHETDEQKGAVSWRNLLSWNDLKGFTKRSNVVVVLPEILFNCEPYVGKTR